MTSNLVSFSWSGSGSTYKVLIGSASGASDVLSADVTGTSYTWNGPRTAGIYYARVAATSGGQAGTASTELPVFTLDMRNAIDAMFFGGGPMSESPTVNPGNASAAIWPDGITVNVLVTEEAGSVTMDALRSFLTDYLAATSNHITITLNSTPLDYHGTSVFALPQNTVVARVYIVCGQAGVIACANYGPLPVGPGSSFVNLNLAPSASVPGGSVAISHEVGHSFGLHHIEQSTSARPEFRFLMNPVLVSGVLSTFEKDAISAARAGGLRAGSRRNDALAAGLVLPFGSTSASTPFSTMHVLLDDIVRLPSDIR